MENGCEFGRFVARQKGLSYNKIDILVFSKFIYGGSYTETNIFAGKKTLFFWDNFCQVVDESSVKVQALSRRHEENKHTMKQLLSTPHNQAGTPNADPYGASTATKLGIKTMPL